MNAVTYAMGWKNRKPGFYLQKGRSFQTGSGALLGFSFRLAPKAKKDCRCISTSIIGSSSNSSTPLPRFRDIAYVVISLNSVHVSGFSRACYMSCRILTPCFHHLQQTCNILLRRLLFLFDVIIIIIIISSSATDLFSPVLVLNRQRYPMLIFQASDCGTFLFLL